jgi:hypothetical protein
MNLVKYSLICLILLGISVSISYADVVGAWLFNDGSGTVAKDSSGNGNDGEIQGATWRTGKFGGALEFDGDDMVIVPDDDSLDLESFTLAALIKVDGQSGKWQVVASKENRDPTQRNYGMFCNINSGVIHYSFTTESSWNSFDAQTVVTDNEWHYVAATYQRPDFKMYLDGEVDAETAPDTVPDATENVLYIGGCDIGDYWMTGMIDEVILFDNALSQDEIRSLSSDGAGFTPVQPAGKLSETWGQIKTNN